jgi:DNA topoisomerase-6 subunit B
MAPPTNCISPIGEELIIKSLTGRIKADFTVAVTRPPSVYRGNPFLIEAGIAWGGDLPQDDLVSLYRFANRVPLLYQQSGCAITDGVISTEWRNYGLSQSRGALPAGPAVIFVHIASVWVPFTSESKEAIADYDEITKEVKLAVQECGRRLATHIRLRKRQADERRKRGYIEKYLPHIGIALQEILGISEQEKERVVENLTVVLEESRGGSGAVGDEEPEEILGASEEEPVADESD